MEKIELTLEQLREMIQAPTEVLAKQDEILKELKKIKEKIEGLEQPNNNLTPYPPFQPYTCPSNPTSYPPQVWYSTATPYWCYQFWSQCAQEASYQTTSTTKQTLND